MEFLGITLFNWVLIVLIIIFLFIIIRNVYRLMKRRNEYMSLKEAREQIARERGEAVSSDENRAGAQTDDGDEE
ncbi:MAG: hypothetical protein FWE78_00600 [Methanimicrococcus sp.]|nr:hypothetical protein [Methanimicrococcus sp.]